MVKKNQAQAQRHPAPRPNRGPGGGTGRNTPASRETRPWRQWHTSTRPAQTSPLEVTAPKRPQWGRFVYLAIILLIVAAIAKVTYDHVFWYSASGVVAGQHYSVSPSQTVTVQDIYVQPSDHVKAGQTLAKLNSPDLQRQLAQDEANLARLQQTYATNSPSSSLASLQAQKQSLQSQVQSLQTQMNQQDQQINSLQQLVSQGAADGSDLAQVEGQEAQTHAKLSQAQAQLKGVRAQIASIEQNEKAAGGNTTKQRIASLKKLRASIQNEINGLNLKAPVSGEVAKVNVSKGDVVKSGNTAIEIVSKNKPRAYLYFPPAAQNRLQVGQKISITDPNGDTIHMKINKIYPSLQSVPDAFKRTYNPQSPTVVVSAQPVQGEHLPKDMHSGTPVNSRIPRWSGPTFVTHWYHDVANAL